MTIWSTRDFELALQSLKIPNNCQIFIHSSLGMLGTHDRHDPASAVLNSFEKLAHREVRIYIPAFTYSLSEGKIFDPRSKFGLDQMGAISLSSYYRNYPRTIDPIFSVFTNDPLFKTTNSRIFSESFGPGSLFSRLVDSNTFVLNIGTGIGTTLIHEIERRNNVSYRLDKIYKGDFFDFDGNLHTCSKWRSYVRNLEVDGSEADFTTLNRISTGENFISRIKFGKSEITIYRIQELALFIEKTLRKKPTFLTKQGREE